MTTKSSQRSAVALLAVFLLVTALVYLPGLHGSFVYDDATSITGNANIQIENGEFSEWARAAISYPSGTPPFRSLTMLSFAANYALTGLDPYWFKLTNLVIHLLNGLLLFLVLRSLFTLWRECSAYGRESPTFDPALAAVAIAGLWLLLPINLTGVLYAVQRLESLATTFVFLGLWWYLRSRLRMWRGQGGIVGLWSSIILCTSVGVLAKEPAVMLPLYAALIEFCLTGARDKDGKLSRPIVVLFAMTLVVPMIIGLAWLWGRYVDFDSFRSGSAAIGRLITESRVLVDYMVWTLLPSLDSLTLYHDDITRSRGLLDPPTTLASIILLLALLVAALWQRRQRPLFSLGVLWFFAGHLLTGTVLPLILAFEHRNYFSSAGLLLAVSSLVALEGAKSRPRIRYAIVFVAALLYGGTTWMRAQEWSDPLRLATSDALKRPNSPAAQYDYAEALIQVARDTGKDEPVDTALKVLDAKRHLPGASITYEREMISILSASGLTVPPDVWRSVVDKLTKNRATTNDARALSQLNHCFIIKQCPAQDLTHLRRAYEAAMAHEAPSANLLSVHAEYSWYLADERDVAERDMREAARLAPRDIAGQKNLIVVLIHQGKRAEAEAMIESLEAKNHFGMLDKFIEPLRRTLEGHEGK